MEFSIELLLSVNATVKICNLSDVYFGDFADEPSLQRQVQNANLEMYQHIVNSKHLQKALVIAKAMHSYDGIFGHTSTCIHSILEKLIPLLTTANQKFFQNALVTGQFASYCLIDRLIILQCPDPQFRWKSPVVESMAETKPAGPSLSTPLTSLQATI